MKKLLTSLVSLSSACVALAQSESAAFNGFFAQAHGFYADTGDLEPAGGGSLVLGVRFADHHSLDLDLIRFTADIPNSFNSGKIEFTPLILGYKYTMPLNKYWNGYVGAGAGAVRQNGTLPYGYYYQANITDTAFAFAFDVGATLNFSKEIALNFNIKSVNLRETELTTEGNIALFRIGLEIR